MNSLFKMALLSTSLSFVLGCDNQTTAENQQQDSVNTVKVSEDNQPDRIFPESREQQQAYAVGATFAAGLAQQLDSPRALGINLEDDFILQGINDVFAGERLIPAAASSELLEALHNDIAQAVRRIEELPN
jgi:hypothetical protein